MTGFGVNQIVCDMFRAGRSAGGGVRSSVTDGKRRLCGHIGGTASRSSRSTAAAVIGRASIVLGNVMIATMHLVRCDAFVARGRDHAMVMNAEL